MTHLGKEDPLFEAVRQMVIETGDSSISRIQRKFLIGYGRAAAMVAALVNDGVTIQNERDRQIMQRSSISAVSTESHQPPVIKVLGIGSGGINAINCMIEKGIRGVEFVAVSSDTEELARCKTNQRLQLSVAQKLSPAPRIAAISDEGREHIQGSMAGADIVFVVAGMGSKTGTNVATIAVQVAQDLGILAIAVVSTPLHFEDNRPRRGDQGIKELSAHADALVIIPNDLRPTEEDMLTSAVFTATNSLMHTAVTGIAESLSSESLISLDIADLRVVIAGMVAMGTAKASGTNRAKVACEQAMASIFPSTMDFADSSSILVNITASSSLKLREVAEIMESVHLVAMDAQVVVAAIFDDAMESSLRVTIYSTGLTSLGGICLKEDGRRQSIGFM